MPVLCRFHLLPQSSEPLVIPAKAGIHRLVVQVPRFRWGNGLVVVLFLGRQTPKLPIR